MGSVLVGKVPWERERQSTPAFLPGKFHGQRSLAGYSPWARKDSNTTEHAHALYVSDIILDTFTYQMGYIIFIFR